MESINSCIAVRWPSVSRSVPTRCVRVTPPNAVDHDADIAKVRELLGHANIATIRIYVRRKMKWEDSIQITTSARPELCGSRLTCFKARNRTAAEPRGRGTRVQRPKRIEHQRADFRPVDGSSKELVNRSFATFPDLDDLGRPKTVMVLRDDRGEVRMNTMRFAAIPGPHRATTGVSARGLP